MLSYIFWNHKFYKIEYYFISEQVQKKFEPIDKEIIFFTQKIVTKLSEIWAGDPGSESRKTLIPDPGSGPRSRIRIRNTGLNEQKVYNFCVQFLN